MYKFVEKLPTINLTNDILILKESQYRLKADWLEFCDHFICNELKFSTYYKDNLEIKEYKPNSNKFIVFPNKLQKILGFGDRFNILDFKYNAGIYSVILTTDYEKMVEQYYFSNIKKIDNKSYGIKSVLSRFFIFQRYKNRLLFPITKTSLSLKYDFTLIFKLNNMYINMIEYIRNVNNKRYADYETNAFNLLLLSCNWNNANDCLNEDINKVQKFCLKNKDTIISSRIKSSVLNKLRLYLINIGMTNIDSPNTFTNSIRVKAQSNIYNMKDDPFEWLSIENNHKLFTLKNDANLYLKRLYADGLKTITCKKYMVGINHMFRYIIDEQSDYDIFDTSYVNKMFDINNHKNFIKYLETKNLTERSLYETLSVVKKFLEFSGLMTPFVRKNMPRKRIGKRTITPRDAMPQDMLNELKNILMINPPKPNTTWEPSRADISWWKFKDVYPVQPLMVLMHLNIPIRGGQLRHLCREKSLVIDKNGNIDRFIINTDKNVNRKTLQEVPNVWDELNIFTEYLKWHKDYFLNLPKYKYNNEDNTPWEDIEPLFLIPNTLHPITTFQYKVYLSKLFCVYQIKINELFKNGEIKHRIKVAWIKNSDKFFNSIEELNKKNDTFINKKVQVAYDIHSLRVTGITRYLDAGVNLNVLLMLTGHVDYNMIVNVYTKFTKEEKKKILRSAVDKLRFDEPETLVQNVENFIFSEIPNKYNTKDSNDVKRAFKENGLFSMERKATGLYESVEMESGVDLAALKHPSTWFPMISGICPGVQCPEGRERKCSLCGYFITGKLFLNGVKHIANMAFASFVRLSKERNNEQNKSSRYCDTKSTKLELLVEEIMGWQQILEKIDNDLSKENHNLPMTKNTSQIIEMKEIPAELAYLETCYNAKLMGVEQDDYGLKLLTIKAIKYAQAYDVDKINLILNSETEAIDYLMGYYLEYKSKNLLSDFCNKILK